MKKFTIKNDIFIKDKRSIFNIMNYIIISLLPIVLLNIYFNINQAFMFIITLFSGIIVKMLVSKKNTFDIREIIITSLIMSILIPNNSNMVIVFILSMLTYFLYLIMNNTKYKVNALVVGLLLIYISNLILGNSNSLLLFKNLNTYLKFDYKNIFSLIKYLLKNGTIFLVFSYFFLTIKRSLKINVVNSYLITSLVTIFIICIINQLNVFKTAIYLLNGSTLFITLYLIANLDTSPLRLRDQSLYGIVLGILIPIFSYYTNSYLVVFIIIIIGNLLVPFLNKYKSKKNV